MTAENKKTKLKWHRFLQFIGWPVGILAMGYTLISYFSDIFGLKLSWTDDSLRRILQILGTDVFQLGPYFWPVVALLALTIFSFAMLVLTWTGSLRWKSYSWKCWIAELLLRLAKAGAAVYVIWEYGINRGEIYRFQQYITDSYGRPVQLSPAMITGLKVLLIVAMVLAAVYTILNIIYYAKRRSLFHASSAYQEPYEDDESNLPEDSTQETVQKDTDVQSETPASVFMNADEPEETTDVYQTEAPAAETESEPLPPVFETTVHEEPAADEPDELDQMLKDTEESMQQFAKKEEPEEAVSETAEEETAQPETAEPITLTLEPEETESAEISRSMPFNEPEEAELPAEEIPAETAELPEEPIAETVPEETVIPAELPAGEQPQPLIEETQILNELPKEAPRLNFCPDCGTPVPDPEMRYCIHCGKKLR